MAKNKKKQTNQMSTSDAVKILATECKILKEQLISTQEFLTNYAQTLELYVDFKGDTEGFVKRMEEKIKEQNEQQADEQVNGRDTDGDNQDEEVGAKGVRSREE